MSTRMWVAAFAKTAADSPQRPCNGCNAIPAGLGIDDYITNRHPHP